MNTQAVIVPMAAIRHQLDQRLPALARQAAGQWQGWLARQQAPDPVPAPDCVPDRAGAQVHVIARPSAFADLTAMIGVTQLLGLAELDCTISFCLPSPLAARLFRAQARRAGIDQLIHVPDLPDPQRLIARLPAEAVICCIPPDVTLAPAFAECLARVLAGDTGAQDAFGTRIGRAGEAPPPPGPALSVPTETLIGGPDIPAHHRIAPDAMIRLFTAAAQRLRFPPPPDARHQRLAELESNTAPRVFLRRDDSLFAAAEAAPIAPPIGRADGRPVRAVLREGSAGAESPPVTLDLTVKARAIQPWMMTCYLNDGGGGNPVIRAFAEGAGCALRYIRQEDPPGGIPVVWGVLRGSNMLLQAARREGRHFFYIDHAYFNRGHEKNYRISRNRFEAGPLRDWPQDRLKALDVKLQPWRVGGREIIVCPPTEYFMTAHNCHDWLEQTLTQLKMHTDRPIVIRTKPKPGEEVKPLPEALSTAHALVTHSSNVAIEAAVMGTPVFVSPSSAAAPVGLTDLSRIETPLRPKRGHWLAHLAYSQFSFDEIRDGTAWRLLQETETRDFL